MTTEHFERMTRAARFWKRRGGIEQAEAARRTRWANWPTGPAATDREDTLMPEPTNDP